MSKITTLVLIALLSTVLPACTTWDAQSTHDIKVSVVALTVASQIRNDNAKPERQLGYEACVKVLDQFIETKNTSTEELSTILHAKLKKILPANLAASISKELAHTINNITSHEDNAAKILKAEKTMRDGIVMGLFIAQQTSVASAAEEKQKAKERTK